MLARVKRIKREGDAYREIYVEKWDKKWRSTG